MSMKCIHQLIVRVWIFRLQSLKRACKMPVAKRQEQAEQAFTRSASSTMNQRTCNRGHALMLVMHRAKQSTKQTSQQPVFSATSICSAYSFVWNKVYTFLASNFSIVLPSETGWLWSFALEHAACLRIYSTRLTQCEGIWISWACATATPSKSSDSKHRIIVACYVWLHYQHSSPIILLRLSILP